MFRYKLFNDFNSNYEFNNSSFKLIMFIENVNKQILIVLRFHDCAVTKIFFDICSNWFSSLDVHIIYNMLRFCKLSLLTINLEIQFTQKFSHVTVWKYYLYGCKGHWNMHEIKFKYAMILFEKTKLMQSEAICLQLVETFIFLKSNLGCGKFR